MALQLVFVLVTVLAAGIGTVIILKLAPFSFSVRIKNFLTTVVTLLAFYYGIQWFL